MCEDVQDFTPLAKAPQRYGVLVVARVLFSGTAAQSNSGMHNKRGIRALSFRARWVKVLPLGYDVKYLAGSEAKPVNRMHAATCTRHFESDSAYDRGTLHLLPYAG